MQKAKHDRKINPPKIESDVVVLIPMACGCSWRPYPHFGHGYDPAWERVTREEYERRKVEGGGHVYSQGKGAR